MQTTVIKKKDGEVQDHYVVMTMENGKVVPKCVLKKKVVLAALRKVTRFTDLDFDVDLSS